MAGPGGGSRGGGGHGGGFGGGGGFRGGGHSGGFGGGGFHGGYHGGYHHHRHYGPGRHIWFGGPFFGYGYGGGCLSVLIAPMVLLIIAAAVLFSFVGGAFGSISEGGVTDYQEREFQDYADKEYRKAFGTSSAYEDNILLVFLTNEDADEYYFIAWVGDHVNSKINNLFGNEYTELGYALETSININGYWYSLDSNLASAVDTMADYIESLNQASSFTCTEQHNSAESKLINYTDMDMTAETVNNALADFTARTGITMSIVVDDMDEVFGVDYSSMITGIVIVVALIGLAIFLVYRGYQSYKNRPKNSDNGNSGGYNNYNNSGW